MLSSARRGISYPNPDRSDRPDIPAHILNLVNALEIDVVYAQGTHAARPGAPGYATGGYVYWETDTALLFWWTGGAYVQIGMTAAGINLIGTLGARPAVGAVPVGTLYFATDNGFAYRNNGATWDLVSAVASAQLDYAQITTSTGNIGSVTTEGTAATVIAGNAITYDGTKVKLEVKWPDMDYGGTNGAQMWWAFFRDSTPLGQHKVIQQTGLPSWGGSYLVDWDTPSAGVHTYSFKGWANVAGQTDKVVGGAGGAGAFAPAWLRVSRA